MHIKVMRDVMSHLLHQYFWFSDSHFTLIKTNWNMVYCICIRCADICTQFAVSRVKIALYCIKLNRRHFRTCLRKRSIVLLAIYNSLQECICVFVANSTRCIEKVFLISKLDRLFNFQVVDFHIFFIRN